MPKSEKRERVDAWLEQTLRETRKEKRLLNARLTVVATQTAELDSRTAELRAALEGAAPDEHPAT